MDTTYSCLPSVPRNPCLSYLTDIYVGSESWAHLDHFLKVSFGTGQVVPVRHTPESHLGAFQVMDIGSDSHLQWRGNSGSTLHKMSVSSMI